MLFFFFILASYQLIIALSIFVICVHGWGDIPIRPIPTKCPEEDSKDHTVMIAHERYCSRFYMCSGGLKFEMKCAVSWNGCPLHFNKLLQVCDYPGRAKCQWNPNYETVLPKCIKPSKKNATNYEEVEEE